MTSKDFERWIERARDSAKQRMADAQGRYGLGGHARYEIDLPTATIRFLDTGGRLLVQADIQVAGSWSPKGGSWLWGWENDSVPAAASSRITAVRDLGAAKRLPALQAGFAGCDEGMAWSMASLAADVLDAECLYRAPGAASQLFLLLFGLRRPD